MRRGDPTLHRGIPQQNMELIKSFGALDGAWEKVNGGYFVEDLMILN